MQSGGLLHRTIPLKSADDLADFDARLNQSIRFAENRTTFVTGFEAHLRVAGTVDTITWLAHHAPSIRFVWLMGADNLATVHKWRHWPRLFKRVPIAVFDRYPYSRTCLESRAATRFRNRRSHANQAHVLARRTPPIWTFIQGMRHPASATAIRARIGQSATSVPEQF